jgi:general secretion pathway protein K
MEDMQGRFNLNNLITPQGTPDMVAVGQFRRLLRVLGLDETLALKALDWMDADNLPQPAGGAEDEAYTRLFPPYQAPNRPMEDVSELLAVEGVDAQTWRLLSPHVTALPVIGPPVPVNVNTATEEVLLSLAEYPDRARVQDWRQRQLAGGMTDLGEVQATLPSRMAERVSLSSNWFALHLAVNADGTRFYLSSLLDRDRSQVRTRRHGLPPEAWLAEVED